MNHAGHLLLLRDGVGAAGGVWADLGAGSGAFTLALAELLGPAGLVYAVDRDPHALQRQVLVREPREGWARVEPRVADFTRPLELPLLDGAVMANSLHFQQEKAPVVRLIRGALKAGGRLILVEYDTDRGNHWVPYPLSYPAWKALASRCGFERTRLLATVPSSFLGRIYSVLSLAPASAESD